MVLFAIHQACLNHSGIPLASSWSSLAAFQDSLLIALVAAFTLIIGAAYTLYWPGASCSAKSGMIRWRR